MLHKMWTNWLIKLDQVSENLSDKMPDKTSNRTSRPNSVKKVRPYIMSNLRNKLDNASEITSDKISEYMAGKIKYLK